MTAPELLVPLDTFRQVFPLLGHFGLSSYPVPLSAALVTFDVKTPKRIAAFLAQVGHESSSLTRWEESFAYSAQRLLDVFPRRFAGDLVIAQQTVARGPEAIAERLYGRRPDLGNVGPGDGWLFRGRGPIQLTGRLNYAEFGQALNEPLEREPDLVKTAQIGFLVAGRFWATRGCNELADVETVASFWTLSHRINGGREQDKPNGWEDRLGRWAHARQVFGLKPVTS